MLIGLLQTKSAIDTVSCRIVALEFPLSYGGQSSCQYTCWSVHCILHMPAQNLIYFTLINVGCERCICSAGFASAAKAICRYIDIFRKK
jgi:hypothetical protein